MTSAAPAGFADASEPKFAVAKGGTKHEEAAEMLRAFAAGERLGYLQVREAASLALEMLDHLKKSTSYQTCAKHGAINATTEYACPRCYAEANAEVENLKRDLLR